MAGAGAPVFALAIILPVCFHLTGTAPALIGAEPTWDGVLSVTSCSAATSAPQLLRFLSDAQLRRRSTAETDKVESCNNFSSWCRIGNAGVIAANDLAEQEKILKFSTLMTNAVIFHTTLDMMTVIRELIAEGWQITPADLAVLSPYVTARIQRFGVYATDEIALTPEPFNAHLDIDLAAAS